MKKYTIIKTKIIEKGYTNKEVAKMMNISEQTLSNWINGKNMKQIEKFIELCQFLNIDIKDLK